MAAPSGLNRSSPHAFQGEETAVMKARGQKDGPIGGCEQSGLLQWGEKVGNRVTSYVGL